MVAVTVADQIEVVLAAFAVGSVAIGRAVDAMPTVAGVVVQVLVEVALGGEPVAVAS